MSKIKVINPTTRIRRDPVEGWWIDRFQLGMWMPVTWTAGNKQDALETARDILRDERKGGDAMNKSDQFYIQPAGSGYAVRNVQTGDPDSSHETLESARARCGYLNGGDGTGRDEQKGETVRDIRLTNALRSLNDGYGLLEAAAVSAKVQGDNNAQEIWQYSREGLALVKQVTALIKSRKVK